MLSNNGSLKNRLVQLREGEVVVLGSKDLANYYCGGKCPIPAHRTSPFHQLEKVEKQKLTIRAYKELIVALKFPPEGIEAEELPGSEFRIQFVRMEKVRP
jgi:hypothetical protein